VSWLPVLQWMKVRLRATCFSGPPEDAAGAEVPVAPAGALVAAGEPAVPAVAVPPAVAAVAADVAAVVAAGVFPATAWRVAFAFWLLLLLAPHAASRSAVAAPAAPARNCRRETSLD
jgi:hypothetical protein